MSVLYLQFPKIIHLFLGSYFKSFTKTVFQLQFRISRVKMSFGV
jgi:hypothetical protein